MYDRSIISASDKELQTPASQQSFILIFNLYSPITQREKEKRERETMCGLKCSMGLFKDFCCSSASVHQGQKRKRAPLFLSGEDRKGQERKSEESGGEIFRDAIGQLLPQSLLLLSIDP